MTLRVTLFGDAPSTTGGIAAVLRNYAAGSWSLSTVRVVGTYHSGDRTRTVLAWLRALALVGLASHTSLGVVHVHLATRGSFVREGAVLLLAAARGRPVVATVHGADFVPWSSRRPCLAGTVLRRAAAVTALSHDVEARVQELGAGPVHLVPNAVAIGPVRTHEPGQVVVMAGELTRRKGVDVLLDAWPSVRTARPAATLVLIGPAGDVALDGRTGPEHGVVWRGGQPHTAVLAELGRARVAVLPSRHEGMPMFLLEAMAAGCAVVATPVGGVPDVLEPLGPAKTVPGELVPVGDASALADALVRSLSPELAARRGAAAREVAETRFSTAVVHSRMEIVWHQVAGATGQDRKVETSAAS